MAGNKPKNGSGSQTDWVSNSHSPNVRGYEDPHGIAKLIWGESSNNIKGIFETLNLIFH